MFSEQYIKELLYLYSNWYRVYSKGIEDTDKLVEDFMLIHAWTVERVVSKIKGEDLIKEK